MLIPLIGVFSDIELKQHGQSWKKLFILPFNGT